MNNRNKCGVKYLAVYIYSIIIQEDIQMKITDIKIRKVFAEGPMKAIASVTFDHQLVVHDIKVIYAREKYFIVMPSRKNADDTYRDIVHPINAEFRATLETAVKAAYDAELEAIESTEETEITE